MILHGSCYVCGRPWDDWCRTHHLPVAKEDLINLRRKIAETAQYIAEANGAPLDEPEALYDTILLKDVMMALGIKSISGQHRTIVFNELYAAGYFYQLAEMEADALMKEMEGQGD